MDTNVLYYGDNLHILRHYIPDESVDLIYLDPPFNSQATYNILFREETGAVSHAQIEAFEDTWHWGDATAQAYDEVLRGPHQQVARMLRAMVTVRPSPADGCTQRASQHFAANRVTYLP
jgi:site-specific DNA-methyltransferase (adenine-specific)